MFTQRVRTALVREPGEPSVEAVRIRGPVGAERLIRELIPEDASAERFVTVALDTQNRSIAAMTTSVGILNCSLIHPREVFAFAICAGAASILLGHNHPSGDPEPSPEDLEVTWQLAEAGRIVGIPVRDHIIIGTGEFACGYRSLLERGLIPQPTKEA